MHSRYYRMNDGVEMRYHSQYRNEVHSINIIKRNY